MSKFSSPLRYPGGKQKLTPFIAEILDSNYIDGNYVEPYAGGGGIAIRLLVNEKVKSIHLNDKDYGVYCFWKAVVDSNSRFCDWIYNIRLDVDEWKRQRDIFRDQRRFSEFEVGTSFFYLNRCNRSGVLTGGVIGGLNQSGKYKIDARFNRQELVRRIELIGSYKDSISLSNIDAIKYINEYVNHLDKNTLVYLDPPYYVKGQHLYMNHYKKQDHLKLKENIYEQLSQSWVLSYDAADEIIGLYRDNQYFTYSLRYSAASSYLGSEVFFFSSDIHIPVSSQIPFINLGLQNMVYE